MDFNISNQPGSGPFQPQGSGNDGVRKSDASISGMIERLRDKPNCFISRPAAGEEERFFELPKEVMRACIRSVSLGRRQAITSTAQGVVNYCSRMAQLELAEEIAEQANQLPPAQKELFWKNIAVFTWNLRQKG